MPLPNRVDPFGDLFATPTRGTLFGNRGGKFHRDDKTLGSRRWASRQWICCVLKFKGRQRNVWGRYYTELFFLDEVTAFAAGHRPCFECRRQDAERFAVLFSGKKQRASVDAMDSVLHAERLDGKAKRTIAAASSRCRMVRWLPSTAKSLPFATNTCCRGHRPAIRHRNPALAILRSTCSRRHRSSPYSDGAMRHSGIRAQAKVVRSAGCWSQPGRGAPRRKTRWQT